jgi:hypothetical protein
MSGLPRDGGTLSVSWGRWAGFYWHRGYCLRLCLGWIALTYLPRDLDNLLHDLMGPKIYTALLKEACPECLRRLAAKRAEMRS